jgi:hypothetical protein
MANRTQADTKTAGNPGENSPLSERYYSPAELAAQLNFSTDKIRKLFENESGVLVFTSPTPRRGKRPYKTLRIPESVLQRVLRRLSTV